MKRKKRMPIKLITNEIRYKMSKWLRKNRNKLFNVPSLCEEIGLNPDSAKDQHRVYGSILYWRKKFIDEYYKWKKADMFKDMDRYEAWGRMLLNFNQNDAYVFLSKYDHDSKVFYYIQPSFDELEIIDYKRLNKEWKGITTIIKEMQIEDANLVLPDGEREPITTLLKASKDIEKLLPSNDNNLE